jgi:site-specific DNA recombinase
VLSLDRLGRKARIILDLVDQLGAAGAELVSCKESLDTTTPTGRFVLGIFAGLAQLERDTIVERTTDGRNARGRRDGEKGGRLPYGYVRGADGPTIDRSKAAIVRQIFKLRAKRPRLTLRQIADALGNTPGPRGGRWHPSSVAEVLRHEAAYRGGPRGDSLVCWPAIVSAPSTSLALDA